MGEQTVFQKIVSWLAGWHFRQFLKLNRITEMEYFKEIAEAYFDIDD